MAAVHETDCIGSRKILIQKVKSSTPCNPGVCKFFDFQKAHAQDTKSYSISQVVNRFLNSTLSVNRSFDTQQNFPIVRMFSDVRPSDIANANPLA
jgi:hypothetical protein